MHHCCWKGRSCFPFFCSPAYVMHPLPSGSCFTCRAIYEPLYSLLDDEGNLAGNRVTGGFLLLLWLTFEEEMSNSSSWLHHKKGGPASCVELLVWLNQLCETIPQAYVPQFSGWLKWAKELKCQLLNRSGGEVRTSNGGWVWRTASWEPSAHLPSGWGNAVSAGWGKLLKFQ